MEPKIRKPQSAEEYAAQRAQFEESGPQINTENWLLERMAAGNLDTSVKTDQAIMFHACERAYFIRDYPGCLKLIEGIESKVAELEASDAGKYTKLKKQIAEVEIIKKRCMDKLACKEEE